MKDAIDYRRKEKTMEPSKNITEAIGNLAMRYHKIELDIRD